VETNNWQGDRRAASGYAGDRWLGRLLGVGEHGVAAFGLVGRNLFLEDVPVFGEEAVGDTEYVNAYDGLFYPADVTAVNHNVVPFGDGHAGV